MRVYAESSAILRWLLGGPDGARVQGWLAEADCVLASRLTWIEIRRALVRATTTGEFPRGRLASRSGC